MQVLQAGDHKFILLELDPEVLQEMATQLGLECRLEDGKRAVTLDLSAPGRRSPLLLFDASDSGNLGWFSRCQFYVDGQTGNLLQTPVSIANQRDPSGRIVPNAVRLRIGKELPESFRLPARQPISEQAVYQVLYNFLNALINSGVAVCGGPVVKPLAGRKEGASPRR